MSFFYFYHLKIQNWINSTLSVNIMIRSLCINPEPNSSPSSSIINKKLPSSSIRSFVCSLAIKLRFQFLKPKPKSNPICNTPYIWFADTNSSNHIPKLYSRHKKTKNPKHVNQNTDRKLSTSTPSQPLNIFSVIFLRITIHTFDVFLKSSKRE